MTGLHNDYLKIIKNIKSYYDNVTFSMDTNDDPKNKWGKEIYGILNNIDVFFVNKKEALMITKKTNIEDALDKLGKEVKIVIIKLGSNGYIAKDGNDIYKGESLNVNYKDSTAAGDNFDAGFIYGFINNLGVKVYWWCRGKAKVCQS
jgi:sugar/nucleoside kinase (ribokinase family)